MEYLVFLGLPIAMIMYAFFLKDVDEETLRYIANCYIWMG